VAKAPQATYVSYYVACWMPDKAISNGLPPPRALEELKWRSFSWCGFPTPNYRNISGTTFWPRPPRARRCYHFDHAQQFVRVFSGRVLITWPQTQPRARGLPTPKASLMGSKSDGVSKFSWVRGWPAEVSLKRDGGMSHVSPPGSFFEIPVK
jgi:hypothetical protein